MRLYTITVHDSEGSPHEFAVFDNELQALEFRDVCLAQYKGKLDNEDWVFGYTECLLNTPIESLRVIEFD
jgi:hypothetical protein